jgi:hypothetical protein
MVGLGDLPGGAFYSHAFGVSADGSIVVGTSPSDLNSEAFLWNIEDGMMSLKYVLENEYSLDLTGWNLTSATAISDNGLNIVGYGTNPDGNWEAWLVTTPEPTTLLLLGFGAVVLRKKRGSQTAYLTPSPNKY